MVLEMLLRYIVTVMPITVSFTDNPIRNKSKDWFSVTNANDTVMQTAKKKIRG